MGFSALISTTSAIMDGIKIVTEYKDKKKYKKFIGPYRKEFFELFCIFYNNKTFDCNKLLDKYKLDYGIMRFIRYTGILEKLGLVEMTDYPIETIIMLQLKDKDLEFLQQQLDSGILDPYLLIL